MVKRVAGVLAGVAMVSEGMRVSKQGASGSGKTLAGVPVLNYQTAYGGQARSSADEKEHWVVFAKKGVESKTLEDLCKSSGACEKTGNPSQGGVPFFEVYVTEERLEKVLLAAPDAIEFVEPDGFFELDDPEPTFELGDNPASASWGLDTVGVDDAQFTGAGSHIYVLDTGLRVTHDDFTGRASPALDCSSGDLVVCDSSDTTCARDRQGHGTHCAGTAAGDSYGVARGAFLYGVKVLSDQGSGASSWSFMSLDWIATKGLTPRVASMSLGSRGVNPGHGAAVDAAVAAGVVVSVAGGNTNGDACGFSPAYVASAITVGSTTRQNARSSFSNYGRCTNLWAPGSDIVSAGHISDTARKSMSGTSMACPHVSGAAALLLEENPTHEPSEIMATLQFKAADGFITGLFADDVNYLLWVGEGDAAPPDAPCRRRFFSCA